MHSQAEKEAERATKWAGMAQHVQLDGEDLHRFNVNTKVCLENTIQISSATQRLYDLVHQACVQRNSRLLASGCMVRIGYSSNDRPVF